MALYHSAKGSVGYDIIGSPTIVDGVASGFSANDYLTVGTANPSSNAYYKTSFEMQVKATMPSTLQDGMLIYYPYIGTECGFKISQSGRITWFIGKDSSSTGYSIQTATGTITANETVLIKGVITNGIAELFKNNTSLATLDISSIDAPSLTNNTVRIGVTGTTIPGAAFAGSIDLNETYIKVNGQPWFGVCPIEVKKHQMRGPVGYTIVGNPTIVDGVVNNFSTTDYLTLPTIDLSNPFEIMFKVKTPATWGTAYDVVLGAVTNNRYTFQKNGPNRRFSYYVPNTDGTARTQHDGLLGLLEDTVYYIRTRFTGTDLIIDRSTDKETWTTEYTEQRTVGFFSSAYAIGRNGTAAQQNWTGSMDLNETYIKVNGKLWFWQPRESEKIIVNNTLVWEKAQ